MEVPQNIESANEEAPPKQEVAIENISESPPEEASSSKPLSKKKAKKLEKQHGKEKKEMKKNKKMQQRVAAAQIRAAQKKKAAQSAVVGADGNIDIDSHPFLKKLGPFRYTIKKGFVPDMKVEGCFYATDSLAQGLMEELEHSAGAGGNGGFLPALQQTANVACLPGIVGKACAMPDAHSGYGFAIGNVAATDLGNPDAVVSPGGVGYDINCGVRLLRTNLTLDDLPPATVEEIAQCLYDTIPVGVGNSGSLQLNDKQLDELLRKGMKWALEQEICTQEDIDLCEEGGCMEMADPNCVSQRAKKRGLTQAGSLGSGNHYTELQVVEEVYDEAAAAAMGLQKGTICVMIHSGSRGLGHQVCSDFLEKMQKEVMRDPSLMMNDRQLSCVRVQSKIGQDYLKAMAAAANFAFVNRTAMAHQAGQVLCRVMGQSRSRLGIKMVYDVAHNIAKIERHVVDGQEKEVLVHRKGATRAFAPGHPQIPQCYQEVGQPVLIGGSMGSCSYVLAGTQVAMEETFGSTCHGAGRQMSRSQAKREVRSKAVMRQLASQGICVKVATPELISEEATEAYKDVSEVVEACHGSGISKKVVKLRPLACVKG